MAFVKQHSKAAMRWLNQNTPDPEMNVFDAIENDNMDILKAWHYKRELNNDLNQEGQTVLHVACFNGSKNCFTFLAKNYGYALVNIQDSQGWTPLVALMNGYKFYLNSDEKKMTIDWLIQAATTLFSCGALPGKCSQNTKSTFLHLVAELPLSKDLEKLIELCISKGGDICAADSRGCNPLFYACLRSTKQSQEDCPKMIKYLFKLLPPGKHLTIDRDGYTCAHAAASSGNIPALKTLYSLCPEIFNMSTKIGTPFTAAFTVGQLSAARVIENFEEAAGGDEEAPRREGNVESVRSLKYGLVQVHELTDKINQAAEALLNKDKTQRASGVKLQNLAETLVLEMAIIESSTLKLEEYEKQQSKLQEQTRNCLENTKRFETMLQQRDVQRISIDDAKVEKATEAVAMSGQFREELVRFVRALRDPATLAPLLSKCNDNEVLLFPTVMFSLYNPFETQSHIDILKLMKMIAEAGAKISSKPPVILEKMIATYFRAFDGFEYLSTTFNVLMTEILETPSLIMFDRRGHMTDIAIISKEEELASAENLKKYLRRLRSELIASVKYFPYGLRWLMNQMIDIFKNRNDAVQALNSLIIQALILPAIFSPERYGIIDSGLLNDGYAKLNYQELAKHLTHDPQFLEDFFDEFTKIVNIDKYFTKTEPPSSIDLILQIGQIKLLSSLLDDTHPLQLSRELRKKLSQYINPRVVYLKLKPPAQPTKAIANVEIANAKSKLRELLCAVEGLNNADRKVVQVLLSILEGNTHRERHVLMTLLLDSLSTLAKLPNEYQENDYAKLLDEMLQESRQRTAQIDKKLQQTLLSIKKLEKLYAKLLKQQAIYKQCLASTIVRYLYSKCDLQKMKERFVGQFQYLSNHECTWNPFDHQGKVDECAHCAENQRLVFSFFRAQETLIKAQEWNKTPEGIALVLAMLQHSVLEELYDSFMKPHPLDLRLNAAFQSVTDLKPEDFEVDTSLSLTFPKEELKAINRYRDPKMKCACILNCRGGIENAIGGDAGADAILPVFEFVLYEVKPTDIFANLRFIFLFSPEFAGASYSVLGALSALCNRFKITTSHRSQVGLGISQNISM